MATIRLDNITKRFGPITALNGVSFDVKDGEFFTILGPPGAGKTTTLRTIVGLEAPEEGDVFLDDERVTDAWPGDRDISIVFQNLALYPDKTVFNNLAFPLKQRKVAKDEIKRRVGETAGVLHIEHLLKRKPAKLSGGERQRVALGRAIVRDPKAYLFDEPISALDALLRLEMRTELKRLQRDLGRTLVYVTHDQVEAMSMADRILVLREGVVQQIDTPERIYHSPANRFVATVIGSPPMNFMPATVKLENGSLKAVHGEFAFRTKARRHGSAEGRRGVLGRDPPRGHQDRHVRRGGRARQGLRHRAARRRDGGRPSVRRSHLQGARPAHGQARSGPGGARTARPPARPSVHRGRRRRGLGRGRGPLRVRAQPLTQATAPAGSGST